MEDSHKCTDYTISNIDTFLNDEYYNNSTVKYKILYNNIKNFKPVGVEP